MKYWVLPLFIILMFIGMIYVGVEVVGYDRNIEESKEAFCSNNNMEFRTVQCGWGCWRDECYSQAGVFELERYNQSYVLIGYDNLDANGRTDEK